MVSRWFEVCVVLNTWIIGASTTLLTAWYQAMQGACVGAQARDYVIRLDFRLSFRLTQFADNRAAVDTSANVTIGWTTHNKIKLSPALFNYVLLRGWEAIRRKLHLQAAAELIAKHSLVQQGTHTTH